MTPLKRSSKSAVLDFIAIFTILFFTWPIIYSTQEAVNSVDFVGNFRTIFNYIVSYFFFYAFPVGVIVINHVDKLDSKRLLINILCVIVLSYILWKSVFMAINHTTTDIFVSIPLFVVIWSMSPVLILIFNNR